MPYFRFWSSTMVLLKRPCQKENLGVHCLLNLGETKYKIGGKTISSKGKGSIVAIFTILDQASFYSNDCGFLQ